MAHMGSEMRILCGNSFVGKMPPRFSHGIAVARRFVFLGGIFYIVFPGMSLVSITSDRAGFHFKICFAVFKPIS